MVMFCELAICGGESSGDCRGDTDRRGTIDSASAARGTSKSPRQILGELETKRARQITESTLKKAPEGQAGDGGEFDGRADPKKAHTVIRNYSRVA
jgi:hypothetical protein